MAWYTMVFNRIKCLLILLFQSCFDFQKPQKILKIHLTKVCVMRELWSFIQFHYTISNDSFLRNLSVDLSEATILNLLSFVKLKILSLLNLKFWTIFPLFPLTENREFSRKCPYLGTRFYANVPFTHTVFVNFNLKF